MMAEMNAEKPKVGADFSYSEKDLLPEVNAGLRERLRKLALVETPREAVHVTQVKAYGEAFQSRACAPKHNGKAVRKMAYSLRLEVLWFGRVFLGSTTLGSASGKTRIGEIDLENVSTPSAWQVETKLDIESVPGMPASAAAAALPEHSEVEALLRKMVKEQGEPILVRTVADTVHELLVEGGIFASKKERASAAVTEEDGESARIAAEQKDEDTGASSSAVYCDDLRRQMLGKEYLRIIDGEDASALASPTWALRICTIHDRDVPALSDKLKENLALQSLDLYFNYIGDEGVETLAAALTGHAKLERIDLRRNQVGDLGLQSIMARLGAGYLPSLVEIDLRENDRITSLGRTMMGALALMRPGVKVRLDE